MLKMFRGQQYKSCASCENPLHFFCTSCDLGLCEDCVVKHLQSATSKEHNVVNYRDRFSGKKATGLCKIHENYERDFVCTSCKEALCSLCVPNHTKLTCNVLKIKDFVEDKVKHINKQNDNLSELIEPRLKSMITTIRENILKIDFHIFENELEECRKTWYGHIDKIVYTLRSYGRKLYFKDRGIMIRRLMRLERLLLQTTKVLQRNGEILKNPEYIVSPEPYCTGTIGIPKMELSAEEHVLEAKHNTAFADEYLDKVFIDVHSLLEKGSVSEKYINEVLTYKILDTVDFQSQRITPEAISCKIRNSVLVYSSNILYDHGILKIDRDFNFIETFALQFNPNGMAVMQNGNVFCLYPDRIIRVTSDFRTQWKKFDDRWTTTDITVSALDEIYACQHVKYRVEYGGRGRVVKWDINGTARQYIDGAVNPNEIVYRNPSHIRINRNSDICVIDTGSKYLKVGNKMGFIRFEYKADRSSFHGLATNSQCHIFINEYHKISEIDENGNRLRYIFQNQSQCIRLFDFDDDDNMWKVTTQTRTPDVCISKVIFRY